MDGKKKLWMLKLVNKKWIIKDTSEQKYKCKKIITTMSIKKLIKILKIKIPLKITNNINNLIINPMYIVSLGIKGIDKKKYTAIYFPEA